MNPEAGELWSFDMNRGRDGQTIISLYLLLEKRQDDTYGHLYRAMLIETGEIIPDLIIDADTIRAYDGKRVG